MLQPIAYAASSSASSYPAQQRLHHPYQHQQQQQQQQPLHHHHHLHHQQSHPLHHDVYAPYQAPLLLAAPAYRPLQQMAVPHSSSQVVAPEQQQQLAALAHQQATTPAAFASHAPDPGLHLHLHHNHNHSSQHSQPYSQQRPRQPSQHHNPHPANMAYQPFDDDMAEMQRLSANYESEVTGPLVGQRQPSSAITQEYATADATYQTKTAALPQKYSHYRKLRGDGMCGWRAVAFGYLERLLYLGDSGKCLEEEARLRSLSNVLNNAGFESYLYEDFADALFAVIWNVANAIDAGNGDEVLLNAFNDEETQNYIITHFKTLTAAWMKTHPENYTGWLIGQTVDQYCDEQVMPMKSEIENVGLSALKDVLLDPASLALEVMYLDRSIGDEVNLHRFDPISGYTAATVRLLYRPGHYDLLYKYEDVPPPPEPVAAYLQHNAPHPQYESIGGFADAADNLMLIPGMSFAPPSNEWMSGPGAYGSDFLSTAFAPVPTCAQALPTPAAPVTQAPMLQQTPSQPAYSSAPQASHVLPPRQMPTELAIRSMPHAEHAAVAAAAPHSNFNQPGGPFRSSAYELEPDFVQTMSRMPLTTSIFKNSHFNTAHFQNPEFQPEEWRPDDDYVTTNSKSSTRSHRSSG
ncbi:hypothetical protein Q7P37_006649 [Cladosporium fusiforme]